jgi:hypothetical protein
MSFSLAVLAPSLEPKRGRSLEIFKKNILSVLSQRCFRPNLKVTGMLIIKKTYKMSTGYQETQETPTYDGGLKLKKK